MTEEQKEFHINRFNWSKRTRNNPVIYAAALSVPNFRQIESYWCGPTTAQQIVTFLKGSANSQDKIAQDMGTTQAGSDIYQIMAYVKNNTGYNYITTEAINRKEDMRMNIFFAMTETRVPPILRLKIEQTGSWLYRSDGHFMNASGINSGGTLVRVTDPNIKNVNPSSTGSYYVTFDEVYTATINHKNHHYAW